MGGMCSPLRGPDEKNVFFAFPRIFQIRFKIAVQLCTVFNKLKCTIMKKLMFIAAVLLFVVSAPACADNDRPVAVSQLPQTAQLFVKNHFPKEKVAYAKQERDFLEIQYEVVFTNGSKLEFFKNGEWKEVNCKYSAVPKAIIPAQITAYIDEYYPGAVVVKIERDSREYEAKLTNGLEITFDTAFNVIDIDD